MQIVVPRSDQRFDDRDLAATMLDSFRATSSFLLHLLKTSPVRLELGSLAGELLPALDHHVHVLQRRLDNPPRSSEPRNSAYESSFINRSILTSLIGLLEG